MLHTELIHYGFKSCSSVPKQQKSHCETDLVVHLALAHSVQEFKLVLRVGAQHLVCCYVLRVVVEAIPAPRLQRRNSQ